jgi:uroporphyrinogen-III synthase
MPPMRLIVTRPEPDASVTAALLRGRGHTVDVVPLLRVEMVAGAELGAGPWSGIVITSANAARAIVAHPRMRELVGRPVFAVGRRSAEAARAVGFAHVASADGDVRDLVRLVAARADRNVPLLYLAGEDRAADLESLLAAHGVALATVVVYRAVAEPSLPPTIRAALAAGAIDGVLHYSRRTADAFVACSSAARIDLKSLKTKHYCASTEVAGAFRQAGVETVSVAAQPDQAALFALIV